MRKALLILLFPVTAIVLFVASAILCVPFAFWITRNLLSRAN